MTYLYDIAGWALHNLGLVLGGELAPHGIEFTCVSSDEWHRRPAPADVLYLSYTGLRETFPYRDWAGTIVTTVHDPCEISHFESRVDWKRLPLLELPFETFDRVSVISAELAVILASEYGVRAYRTPTWPMNGGSLLDHAAPQEHPTPIQVFSSTNVPEFFPAARVLRRFRRPAPYLRDHRGRFSLRQLGGLAVLRRRKNIRLLRQIRDRFARDPRVHCELRFGATSPVPRNEYEATLVHSDVYLCASTMEGGPLPLIEAVFAGLAVVTTPVGQVDEWVHHGENGWICHTPDEFTSALERYASDPALLVRHRRHSVAVARSARFPIQAWVDFLLGN